MLKSKLSKNKHIKHTHKTELKLVEVVAFFSQLCIMNAIKI